MEPVVFKTDNGNCYLYSPAEKSMLPIPLSLYNDTLTQKETSNQIWILLKQKGYLQPYNDKFDGVVDEESIKNALKNLSQVVFETTTSCNLNCTYCCYGEGYETFESRRTQYGKLQFETAKTILDYISMLFKNEVSSEAPLEPFAISFYGGEPLMNFDVIRRIVDYAEHLGFQNRQLFFTMTTNATLLSKYASFLWRHHFKLLISLDGNKKHNVYRKMTNQQDSFEIVMYNLQKVKEKYPEWFTTFRFNTVCTDVSNIKQIVKWFRMNFDKTPNFSPLHTPTAGAKEYVKVKSMMAKYEIPEDMRFSDDLLIQSPINKRVMEFCNSLFKNTIDKEANLFNERRNIPTGTCVPLSKRMFVSYDGKIHPCEKVNRDSPLGEINKDGSVVLNFESIAKDFMSKISAQKTICQKCYLQLCCTKCMLCFNGSECEDFTSKQQFVDLLSQTFSYVENHPDLIQLLKDNVIIK